jgi:hypothetical protein
LGKIFDVLESLNLIFNYEIEMQRWFREKEGQQNNYKQDWPLKL